MKKWLAAVIAAIILALIAVTAYYAKVNPDELLNKVLSTVPYIVAVSALIITILMIAGKISSMAAAILLFLLILVLVFGINRGFFGGKTGNNNNNNGDNSNISSDIKDNENNNTNNNHNEDNDSSNNKEESVNLEVEVNGYNIIYKNSSVGDAKAFAELIKEEFKDKISTISINIHLNGAIYDAVEELKTALDANKIKYNIVE